MNFLLPLFAISCIAALLTSCPDNTGSSGEDPVNLYPIPGINNAFPDGELMIVFDNVPTLVNNQFIYIYEEGVAEPVDTIRIWNKRTGYTVSTDEDKGETQSFGSRELNAAFTRTWVTEKDKGPYWIRSLTLDPVKSTALYITPRHGSLEYDKTYRVVIPAEAIIGTYFDDSPFDGIEWSFTTRSAPHPSSSKPITVDASQNSANSADFRTIWGALNFISTAPEGNYTINVAPGVYNELINYVGPAGNNITINGTGTKKYGADVILQAFNHININGGTGNNHRRNAVYFSGPNNIVLKNITIKNLDGHTGDQAEALHFGNAAGKFRIAYNCGFFGHQDTILTSGRVWFYQCYIEGDTDFIWGSSDVALFEECEITGIDCKAGYMFVARLNDKADTVGKGYVALNSSLHSNRSGTFFARTLPASTGSYCQVAIINGTISGSFASSLWQVSHSSFLGNGEHVGFKVYNLTNPDGTPFNVSGKHSRTSIMTDDLYNQEYSSRSAILNRVYNRITGLYEDAPVFWEPVF
ncbi:MAG: pectinesterase family protein [Treponema sp.]|nr:pectinesterase family protein [Treponema sp.]